MNECISNHVSLDSMLFRQQISIGIIQARLPNIVTVFGLFARQQVVVDSSTG